MDSYWKCSSLAVQCVFVALGSKCCCYLHTLNNEQNFYVIISFLIILLILLMSNALSYKII